MNVFEALADPTRRQIVELVATRELSAGDIASRFDVTRPAVSRHLRVLREAGLVTDRKEGRWVYYTLVPEALTALRDALAALTTPGGPRRQTWWSCCE